MRYSIYHERANIKPITAKKDLSIKTPAGVKLSRSDKKELLSISKDMREVGTRYIRAKDTNKSNLMKIYRKTIENHRLKILKVLERGKDNAR